MNEMNNNHDWPAEYKPRQGLAAHLLLYGKGITMGMGDSVPGVSGGTIAVITHIYDELVHSIKSVDLTALKLILRGSFKQAWMHINGNFLLVLGVGIVSGLLVSANTVLYLLEHHFPVLMGFFIGLVLASCVILGRQLQWRQLHNWLSVIAGALLVTGIAQLPVLQVQPSPAYLFMAGAIAICAMLLPGLSGAFILILLGAYEVALRALIELQWLNIAVFVAGCGIGLLCFSRLLDWLLHNYHQTSYGFIFGLLSGSLLVLWPWQRAVEFYLNSDGQREVLRTGNVLPTRYYELTGNDPTLLFTAIALLCGFALVLGLERLSRTYERRHNLADRV
ncbi:MAG: DUF368 domain-containing protein [Pseudohongiellaceae bacterium]